MYLLGHENKAVIPRNCVESLSSLSSQSAQEKMNGRPSQKMNTVAGYSLLGGDNPRKNIQDQIILFLPIQALSTNQATQGREGGRESHEVRTLVVRDREKRNREQSAGH